MSQVSSWIVRMSRASGSARPTRLRRSNERPFLGCVLPGAGPGHLRSPWPRVGATSLPADALMVVPGHAAAGEPRMPFRPAAVAGGAHRARFASRGVPPVSDAGTLRRLVSHSGESDIFHFRVFRATSIGSEACSGNENTVIRNFHAHFDVEIRPGNRPAGRNWCPVGRLAEWFRTVLGRFPAG